MKNVFKVLTVIVTLGVLVSALVATGVLANETSESKEIATWSDKGGVNYTYFYGERAFANLYSYCEGTNGTWGEFAEKIANIDDNQYVKVVLTGEFAGATTENALMSSRVWNETTEKFAADSASDNEVVFRIQGPLTSKLTDPNIDFTFNAGMTGISEMANTHVTVTVYEGDAEAAATATEAEAEETEPQTDKTEADPTETEPVVTDPTEPVVTEPESTETEPVVTDPTEPVVEVVYGDANGDGEINLKDVLAARKYVAGMESEINLVASDVNKDGAVNMKDILLIRKYVAGIITEF